MGWGRKEGGLEMWGQSGPRRRFLLSEVRLCDFSQTGLFHLNSAPHASCVTLPVSFPGTGIVCIKGLGIMVGT